MDACRSRRTAVPYKSTIAGKMHALRSRRSPLRAARGGQIISYRDADFAGMLWSSSSREERRAGGKAMLAGRDDGTLGNRRGLRGCTITPSACLSVNIAIRPGPFGGGRPRGHRHRKAWGGPRRRPHSLGRYCAGGGRSSSIQSIVARNSIPLKRRDLICVSRPAVPTLIPHTAHLRGNGTQPVCRREILLNDDWRLGGGTAKLYGAPPSQLPARLSGA